MALTDQGHGDPSTLADVIGQIKDAFDAMGDATPILIGKQYLVQGVGSGPRVVFVPERRGRGGDPLELGSAVSVTHSCDVLVRGPEEGDDLERFRATYRLADRVMDCIATAATGRLEWGGYGDDSPTDVDAYGAEIAFSFTYTRDVRHDAARWALAPATVAATDPVPLVPPGEPAATVTTTITTVPEE